MYSVFASVGLGMLIPAMSLRHHTKEYIPIQKLDEAASGCFSCPFYRTGSDKCETCARKQYYTETAVRYINEESRYGHRQPLKKNALLLYIYLHFLSPDENGHVAKIDPEEIAASLACTPRTVINNLLHLHDTGYILLGKHSITGYYQAFIADYKDIFKKANQGGRGFLRLGSDFLSQLSRLPDTNSIRLAIRSYISNVETSNKPQADRERSLKDIKTQLPAYVTKKKLLSVLADPVFNLLFSVSTKTRSATIIVNPAYDQTKLSDLVRQTCRNEVSRAVEQINKDAKGTKTKPGKFPLRLNERDWADITNISLKLPINSIVAGVRHFYDTYVARNLHYSSPGALIRSFASDHAAYGFISG